MTKEERDKTKIGTQNMLTLNSLLTEYTTRWKTGKLKTGNKEKYAEHFGN